MFDSVILDVAIGLVFLYFFLSMPCSVIIEGYAANRKWRAQDLYSTIQLIFDKDDDMVKRFYGRPLFPGTRGAGKKPPTQENGGDKQKKTVG